MRGTKKTPRYASKTSSQQQSNIFKTSLRAWQARFKEQRANQDAGQTNTTSSAR